ncbi:MAG: 30S ribosomal protein S16 [Dehalococcoidia bacterium]
MIRIRLARVGKKKQPSYRLVVSTQEAPRDGRFIEILGHYNPLKNPAELEFNAERTREWIAKGAQPSEAAAKILAREGIGEAPRRASKPPAPAKAPAEAAPKPAPAAKAEPAAQAEPAAEAEAAAPEAPEPEPATETEAAPAETEPTENQVEAAAPADGEGEKAVEQRQP